MRATDHELLKRTALGEALGASSVRRLISGSFVQCLPKDAVLFTQGEPAEFAHVILSGRIAILAKGPREEEAVLEFFGPADIVEVAAVVLRLPYFVSARVASEARILMLPAEMFRAALAQNARLAEATVTVLSRHWRLLTAQIVDLKLRSASQRLASYLLTTAENHDGAITIELTDTRRALAARLGIAPESLSRSLAQLEPLGVQVHGRRIEISDLAELRQFCRFEDPL